MKNIRDIEINNRIAEFLLSKSVENRPINKSRVRDLVRTIKAGEWDPNNPHGIVLGKNSILIDGHHRLHAILISGVTVKCVVIEDDSLETPRGVALDLGHSRHGAYQYNISREAWEVGTGLIRSVKNRALWDGFFIKKKVARFLECNYPNVLALRGKSHGKARVRSIYVAVGVLARKEGVDLADISDQLFKLSKDTQEGMTGGMLAYHKWAIRQGVAANYAINTKYNFEAPARLYLALMSPHIVRRYNDQSSNEYRTAANAFIETAMQF